MSSILNLLSNPTPTESTKRIGRDCAIELLATTLFVYCGTGSAVAMQASSDDSIVLPIALSFGITITFMAYSVGHLTGGHMNPAVSLLMFLKGQMSGTKMVGYMVCQLLGAMLASSLVSLTTKYLLLLAYSQVWQVFASTSGLDNDLVGSAPFNLGSNTVNEAISPFNAFVIELMGSFIFYFVIAQTALDNRGIAQTSFPALPIGLSLVIVHICLIPFTGCGVNPARTFGPSMVTCMHSSTACDVVVQDAWWVYWVAPFLAAFLVAEVTNLMECECDEEDEDNDDTMIGSPVKEVAQA